MFNPFRRRIRIPNALFTSPRPEDAASLLATRYDERLGRNATAIRAEAKMQRWRDNPRDEGFGVEGRTGAQVIPLRGRNRRG